VNELSLSEMVGGFTEEPRRRSRRGSERRRKKRRRRTLVMILSGLLVLGMLGAAAWLGLRPLIASFDKPTDYAGPGNGSVQVLIPDGATGDAIGQVLQADGVVLTAGAFVTAYGDNPASGGIQPGTYRMQRQMSSKGAVAALLTEANRLLDRVTVPEGIRVAQLPALIAGKTKIPLAALTAALASPTTLGLPPQANGNPEGWLFPATYDVQPNTDAASVLQQMVAKTVALLTAKGVPPAQWQQVLIKASLVQAEAKNAVDFGKIAQVFDNRLAKGMKLQLDTTVHYAMGKFTVATSDQDTLIKSPYNTYVVPGLPIGPIGDPGEQAVDAVLSPTPGPWVYFVAVNPSTGLTKYATTAAEFAVLKAELNAWEKAHPGQ
jgi:UPF0755 protein